MAALVSRVFATRSLQSVQRESQLVVLNHAIPETRWSIIYLTGV